MDGRRHAGPRLTAGTVRSRVGLAAVLHAVRATGEGDGESGSRHQQEAQRLLEMARDQQTEDGESEGHRDDGTKKPAKHAEIPDKTKHKGPADFRRRVIEGLGGSADPLLREAVKRYAEGLLK